PRPPGAAAVGAVLAGLLSAIPPLAAAPGGLGGGAPAADGGQEATFTALTLENDWLTAAGADRWYTGGIKLSWATEERPPPRWLQRAGALAPGLAVGAGALWGISLEQRTFTPADITDPALPPADRPYAGWLNLSLEIAERSPASLGRLRLGIGITGEPSLARQNQEATHDLLDSDEPVGWGTQLPAEPTFQVAYDRQWLLCRGLLAGPLAYRLSTAAGAALGTALTQAGAGASVALGQRLPRDFGPPRITAAPAGSLYFDSGARHGWYLSLGANARLVAHNLFLDGNVFRDSPAVDRRPGLAEGYVGLVYYTGRLRLSMTWVHRSEAFEGQREPQEFGTATLTWAH
ncbi:lipid A deacylase LpxR family protein, partial [Halorhodospira neutriphila]